ncbi:hypothetical protein J7E93_04540 [Streptomyces sp. ISL-36]|uniref:hypothetical protein n=1 Tax=Streptomyces sp. ISL-36 TaxID=2819182 RepID=UPI001BEA1C90|nr:hypothetical protein [Streptomyces sp. ISL-36]MBT2439400.1 hypothetical protein [Streptomyces sp. ISL-36]
MSDRYARKARRGMAAVALAVGLVLVATGCGGEDKQKGDKPAASSRTPKASGGNAETQTQEPPEVLASLKGQRGLELSINVAERDTGGFLTIKGRLTNTSGSAAAIPAQTAGDETEVVKHGNSLGGATLVDSVGKKRYYVLRDTDGRPLTTTALPGLGPGRSTAVFMQFPAPPAGTTEVSFQLPTFEPGTIKLS